MGDAEKNQEAPAAYVRYAETSDHRPRNSVAFKLVEEHRNLLGPFFPDRKKPGEIRVRPSGNYIGEEDPIEFLIKSGPAWGADKADLGVGEYYPRMWRGRTPSRAGRLAALQVEDTDCHREFIFSLQQVEYLSKLLEKVFETVHPSTENHAAYGGEIRNLVILACTEIEAQWKGILKANIYEGRSARWTTRDYIRLCQPLRLRDYRLAFRRFPTYPDFSPFEGWDITKPTSSLAWFSAYNHLKHDREGAFPMGRLGHAIAAVGATFLMLVAQFGEDALQNSSARTVFQISEQPYWEPKYWYYEPLPLQAWKCRKFDFMNRAIES